MSNTYEFPAGSEGSIHTNPETGDKYIFTADDAWVLYHGDHPDFVNLTGDSMTGNLSVPDPVDLTHAVNAGWVKDITDPLEQNKVEKSGDSMEGDLELFRNPIKPMHAATKNYVDQSVFEALNGADSAGDVDDGLFVKRVGDSMSGELVVPSLRVLGDDIESTIEFGGPTKTDPKVPLTSKIGAIYWDDYMTTIPPKTGTWGGIATNGEGQYVIVNRSSSSTYGRAFGSFDYGQIFKYDESKYTGATKGNGWKSPELTSNNENKHLGIHWTPYGPGDTGRWFITNETSKTIWVNNNIVPYSNNWQKRTLGDFYGKWGHIAAREDGTVVVILKEASSASSATQIISSTDHGNNWGISQATRLHEAGIGWTSSAHSAREMWDIDCGLDGRFIVVGRDFVAYSDTGGKNDWHLPGGHWTPNTVPNSKTHYYGIATDGRGMWIALGYKSDDVPIWKVSRNNGNTFSNMADDPDFANSATGLPAGTKWHCIDYMPVGNHGWWCAGSMQTVGGKKIAVSQDGINWTTANYPKGISHITHGKDHLGNDQFVCLTSDDKILRIPVPEQDEKGLFYNGELIATNNNLQPVFDQINMNTQLIGQLSGESDLGEIDLGSSVDSAETIKLIDERIDSADLVHIVGDTMTGFLTLHANPTDDLHAATKAYVRSEIINAVDSATGAITIDSDYIRSQFVEISGDTMTGFLTLHSDPASDSQASTKKYVDDQDLVLQLWTTDRIDSATDSVKGWTHEHYRYLTDSDVLDNLTDVNVPSPTVGDRLVWNGTNWVGEQSTAPHVYYQDLAPVGSNNADMWFNTTTLKMSIWHVNGWVQVGQ